jgi:hypothetical protein
MSLWAKSFANVQRLEIRIPQAADTANHECRLIARFTTKVRKATWVGFSNLWAPGVIVTTHHPGDAQRKTDPAVESSIISAKPSARYGPFGIRAEDGFAQPNYRITGDTIERD